MIRHATPRVHHASLLLLWATPFIIERVVSLAGLRHRPSLREVPRQDSWICLDPCWAVSRQRGDLRVAPAHVGCPDRSGTENWVEQQAPTASRGLCLELAHHRSQAERVENQKRKPPVPKGRSK